MRLRLLIVLLVALASAPLHALEQAGPSRAAIASANAAATDAGLQILGAGGNAYDAAVAVSATLGLVEPESSGLGGGGFFLLRLADGREVFVDARERAPLAASRDMYLDAKGSPLPNQTINGPLAAAIPGLPAALVHVAQKYGRLPLAKSLAPAISLAEGGWVFGHKNATMMGFRKDVLARDPGAAALFLRDGKMPAKGTRMRNPDYAAALRRLARHGHDGFYRGEFARKLVEGVRAAGGNWTVADMEQYAVVERAPIAFEYRGWRVLTAPPPSSGGAALAQMLHVLSGYPLDSMSRAAQIHLLTEAMRRAYRDRAIYLGDPDQVNVPLDLITSPIYAAGLRASINLDKATPSDMLPGISAAAEGDDTTHFSIIDAEGNLAAVTQTVNLPYGNSFVVPGSGFLLNNEMDDFSIKPGVPNAFGLVGEDANAIAPGKRPLSSMTPTIVSGNSRTAVLGTPGGSRIITMVLLGLLEIIDGKGAQEIVALPRFHHQYLPDVLAAEPGAFSTELIDQLGARGFKVSAGERTWGNMQVVLWDHDSGRVEAGTDPRWEGVGKAGTSDAIFR